MASYHQHGDTFNILTMQCNAQCTMQWLWLLSTPYWSYSLSWEWIVCSCLDVMQPLWQLLAEISKVFQFVHAKVESKDCWMNMLRNEIVNEARNGRTWQHGICNLYLYMHSSTCTCIEYHLYSQKSIVYINWNLWVNWYLFVGYRIYNISRAQQAVRLSVTYDCHVKSLIDSICHLVGFKVATSYWLDLLTLKIPSLPIENSQTTQNTADSFTVREILNQLPP